MIPRRTWLVAATFALSWWLAPSGFAQNDQAQNQTQPDQPNSKVAGSQSLQANASQDDAANPGQRANPNSSQRDQQPGNSQHQQPQASQSNSGANPSQDANVAPNRNQDPSQQRAAGIGNSRNKAGNLTYWTAGGPGNEILQWKAFAQRVPLSLAPVDESLRAHLGLPEGEGLLVTAVDPGSPAAEAGIRQNDILIKLDDGTQQPSRSSLATPESFYNRLKGLGDNPVTLTLLRDGKPVTIQVQPKTEVTLYPVPAKAPSRDFWIGVTVTGVEPALRAQLRLPPHGLIVTGVGDASPAARVGILRHDILLDVDGEPLSEPARLAGYVQSKGEKPIVINLIRKGKDRMQMTVTPERKKATSTSAANPLQNNQNLTFQVLQPGVLSYPTANAQGLNVPIAGGGSIWLPNADPLWVGNPYLYQGTQLAPPVTPQDPNSLAKRLDTLDAELKDLRAAVMQYKQTAKALEELNKALTDSLKAIKEKK